MSVFDEVLLANHEYARNFRFGDLASAPARRLAVVCCMDARISVEPILGLQPGDAHIVRNAGGIVTEDVIRSLLVSHYQLGTQEVLIINHTECGMMKVTDEELIRKLEAATGVSSASPSAFLGFHDLDENVRRQVQRVRSHPWIPRCFKARGAAYDVKTGRLREVM